jgi:TetR/AcrR family transcriptional regulator, tetracycline repressor protein
MEAGTLTRERIVVEAKTLLNEEGLDALNVRNLAGRLGIQAPSLYWHFPDKAALMSALLESLFYSVLDAVPYHQEWQAWMRDFGLAMWRSENSARDFGRLVTTTNQSVEQIDRITERIQRAVRGLNLPEADAMRLQSSIQALVTARAAFAGAPYGDILGRTIDFDAQVVQDIDSLIAAEQSRQLSGAHKPSAPA